MAVNTNSDNCDGGIDRHSSAATCVAMCCGIAKNVSKNVSLNHKKAQKKATQGGFNLVLSFD